MNRGQGRRENQEEKGWLIQRKGMRSHKKPNVSPSNFKSVSMNEKEKEH